MIAIITTNNAGCVARLLKQTEYPAMDKIPVSELESALFKIHSADAPLFYDIMKKCEWNKGNNNWTNDERIKNQLIEAVQKHTGMLVDKLNWWSKTLEYLEQQNINN